MVLCPQPLKTSSGVLVLEDSGLHCKNVGKMLWLIQLLCTLPIGRSNRSAHPDRFHLT